MFAFIDNATAYVSGMLKDLTNHRGTARPKVATNDECGIMYPVGNTKNSGLGISTLPSRDCVFGRGYQFR